MWSDVPTDTMVVELGEFGLGFVDFCCWVLLVSIVDSRLIRCWPGPAILGPVVLAPQLVSSFVVIFLRAAGLWGAGSAVERAPLSLVFSIVW